MNANLKTRRLTLVAAAVLASLFGSARAEDITPDPYTHMVSTRTRAEVVAELHAARASGELARANAEDSGSSDFSRQVWIAGKTRAEVRAEVLGGRESRESAAMVGEDSGSFHLARQQAKPSPDASRLAAVTR